MVTTVDHRDLNICRAEPARDFEATKPGADYYDMRDVSHYCSGTELFLRAG